MLIKTSGLTGPALDWAVTFALYGEQAKYIFKHASQQHRYSTHWAQGGPIIEGEKISVLSTTNGHDWAAKGAHNYSYGPTPLIAAMRCYVASQLGDEIDIPGELL